MVSDVHMCLCANICVLVYVTEKYTLVLFSSVVTQAIIIITTKYYIKLMITWFVYNLLYLIKEDFEIVKYTHSHS
jgi:hypothetical protein